MTDSRKLTLLAMTLTVASAGFCGSPEPKAWSYPPEIWSVWELDRARAYMRDEGLRVRYDGRFREPVKTVEFRKGPNGVPFARSRPVRRANGASGTFRRRRCAFVRATSTSTPSSATGCPGPVTWR